MEKVIFIRDWRFHKTPATHLLYRADREYSVSDETAKAARKDKAIKKKEKTDGDGADNGSPASDSPDPES